MEQRRSGWAAALIGIMAAVEASTFHQLLRWRPFFDRSTPAAGLLSDASCTRPT